MNVFVTGATGALGQPVLRRLRAQGVSVKALCRSDANREQLVALGAEPVDVDLLDAAPLVRAVDGCDAVLHLATHIPPAAQMRRRDAWSENDRIRRDGTRCIREAALRSDTVRLLIYPSVSLFYADGGDDWLDATTAQSELAAPLRSTLAAEAEVAAFADSTPDRLGIVLRFGTFYGPSSADARQALAMARRGLALPLAPSAAYRSAIWIDDAATAVITALKGPPSGIYDVVEDRPVTQSESLAALAGAVGRRRLRRLPRWLLRVALPADLRRLLARSQRISNARYRQATGWAPAVADQSMGWMRLAAMQ